MPTTNIENKQNNKLKKLYYFISPTDALFQITSFEDTLYTGNKFLIKIIDKVSSSIYRI